MPISHAKSVTIADGADANVVRPSDWNSVHNYTLVDGITVAGNTAGVGVLISSGTLVLAGGNNITVSQNANTLTISGVNQAFSADASSTFVTLTFQNSNNVSFSNNAGAIRVTHNLAGTNTAITGGASITLNSTGLSFNGSGIAGTNTAVTGRATITLNSTGLSFNGSALVGSGTATAITGRAAITLSPNSSSIALSFDGSGIAGTGFTTGTTTGVWTATNSTAGLSMVMPFMTKMVYPDHKLTAVTAPGNATESIQYIHMPGFLTATRVDALVGMSFSTSVGAGTQTYVESRYCVVYTKNANTLSSASSGSTQTTYTMASNTAGQTYLSNSALYPISVPVNMNMQPGEYFVGFNIVTAATAVTATRSIYGGAQIQTAVNYADFANTATSSGWAGGMGVYSAATTGGVAAVSLSAINQTGSALSAANIAFIFRNA